MWSLRQNEFSKIETNSFCGLSQLFSLDLSNNQLAVIHRRKFDGLPSLKILDLSKNNIKILSANDERA